MWAIAHCGFITPSINHITDMKTASIFLSLFLMFLVFSPLSAKAAKTCVGKFGVCTNMTEQQCMADEALEATNAHKLGSLTWSSIPAKVALVLTNYCRAFAIDIT